MSDEKDYVTSDGVLADISEMASERKERYKKEQKRIARMCNDRFPSSAVDTRKNGNGVALSYASQHYVITRLNEVFGVMGWASTTQYNKLVAEDIEQVNGKARWYVSYEAKVRIRVCNEGNAYANIWHEGTGTGHGFGARKGDATESAAKEAETDALKRAARLFGPSLGLALYDKEQEDVGARLYSNRGLPLKTEYEWAISQVAGAKTLNELYEVLAEDIRPITPLLSPDDTKTLQAMYKERVTALKGE